MMEVDHMSYIFGSFTRRRQSHAVSSTKRKSIDTKVSHDRSKSTPHTTSKPENASPRAKSVCTYMLNESKYKCPMCQKHFIEPRVLPCLHTFCTRCLQELEACEFEVWNEGSDASSVNDKASGSGSGNGSGSGGSGYISDKQEENWSPPSKKSISCPNCTSRFELPPEGIYGLPLNYLVQHRMVLATLNAHTTKLLCDVCSSDVTANTRCSECAINMCPSCTENHRHQKSTCHHEVLSLDEARRKGITRVRRQVMCQNHPERELSIFCTSCCQVICRDCVPTSHRNHSCEPVAHAAKSHTTSIRQALERARTMSERTTLAATRLHATTKKIENQCSQVQSEIERFIQSYLKSVEEHRKKLLQEVNEAKEERLSVYEKQKKEVIKRLNDTNEVVVFADELLNEGTDVEILSFVKPILKRLETCTKVDFVQEMKSTDSLQFLPEEEAVNSESTCPLFGVVTTQTVSPYHCVLHQEALQNLRVGRKAELILETRDSNNEQVQRGGESITAELRHKDAGTTRSLIINVEDRRDGTYRLCFTPDVAGKLTLSIFIRGQLYKGNPIPIIVRTLRPHHGTFHCCSFCSSGGSKEAACGCSGKMPGGYRGCGHGHEGHPGRRHWSCCGNILEHSECSRINSSHYQFTL